MASKKKQTSTTSSSSKKKAAGAAASTTKQKKAREVLLVGSKVRQEIKEAGFNTGGDAIDGLNEWVHWLILQATQRAQANGRKTVRSHDFMVGL